MKRWTIECILAMALFAPRVQAQTFAVKTNLVADALANVSLGAEVGIAKKWTLELDGSLNGWTMSEGKRWKHWQLRPEARYWFCDRWDGHFVGAHLFGGQFNIGGVKGLPDFLGTKFSDLADRRYQGWFAGAGIVYGYDWILGKHWNLEAEVGVGYAYARYDRFRCVGCGRVIDADQPHHYVGLTRVNVSVVYLF